MPEGDTDLTPDSLRDLLVTPDGRAELSDSGGLALALQDPELRPIVLGAFRERREANEETRQRILAHRYRFGDEWPLVPDPTPRLVAGHGIRHRVSPRVWSEIVRRVWREWDSRCATCRTESYRDQQAGQTVQPLFTYACYDYDDARQVATLTRLVPLCRSCLQAREYRGFLRTVHDYDLTVGTLCAVNHCDRNQALALQRAAFDRAQARRSKLWTVEFGDWSELVALCGGWIPGHEPLSNVLHGGVYEQL